ncbi:MAG: ABC transporter permease [Planctomycetota bacterium]
MRELVHWLGRSALRMVFYPWVLAGFMLRVARSVMHERGKGRKLFLKYMILQVFFTGFNALPVATLTAIALGSVILGNAIRIMQPIGQMGLVAQIVPMVVIAEVGPLVVALIIIGRSGTAVTTELGNMQVSREIKVLELLGIDVNYLIVFPRLVGITMAVVALAIYFYAFAIGGGLIAVKLFGLAPLNFTLELLYRNITMKHIVIAVSKCLFIGGGVALIHCHHGLSVRRSTTEVPQQTTRAVVNSIVFTFVVNGIVFLLNF